MCSAQSIMSPEISKLFKYIIYKLPDSWEAVFRGGQERMLLWTNVTSGEALIYDPNKGNAVNDKLNSSS